MEDSTWLEICLEVDGELAEAVAEVLGRYVSGGVVIESTQVEADAEDEGHPVGPLRVCGYLPVGAGLEEKRRHIEEGLWYLGRIRPLPQAQFRSIQETDWAEAWKQHFQPVLIGKRLQIVPAWLEPPEPARIAVRMDPGMAFGTGTHPTTQLCLEIIDQLYPAGPGPALNSPYAFLSTPPGTVIDIGCGSGILAVAALKLGAEKALGVDIDPQSVEAARQNAALNGVAHRLEAGLGSVAEVRAGTFSLRRAPLVLANILAPVLVRLFAGGLAELVQAQGALVLSGILAEQAGEVQAAAEGRGLRLVDRRQVGDWVALLMQK